MPSTNTQKVHAREEEASEVEKAIQAQRDNSRIVTQHHREQAIERHIDTLARMEESKMRQIESLEDFLTKEEVHVDRLLEEQVPSTVCLPQLSACLN